MKREILKTVEIVIIAAGILVMSSIGEAVGVPLDKHWVLIMLGLSILVRV